jgi:N-acyl-D-aspartate/D-glutamate deacylase
MGYLIIREGTVVDGARPPGCRGDVGLRGGRNAELSHIAQTATARRVLDATGCTLDGLVHDNQTRVQTCATATE